jgi:hypothetical protein
MNDTQFRYAHIKKEIHAVSHNYMYIKLLLAARLVLHENLSSGNSEHIKKYNLNTVILNNLL